MNWLVLLLIIGSFSAWGENELEVEKPQVETNQATVSFLQELGLGHCLVKTWGPPGPVNLVAFSPDNTRLATYDGELRIVQVWSHPEEALLFNLMGQSASVSSLTFSNDGKELVVVTTEGKQQRWSMTDGQPVNVDVGTSSQSLTSDLTGDNQKITTGSGNSLRRKDDEIIITSNTEPGRCLAALRIPIDLVTFTSSPNGQLLATVNADYTVQFWSLPEIVRQSRLLAHATNMAIITISPDGRQLLSADYGMTLNSWSIPGKNLISSRHVDVNLNGTFTLASSGQFIASSGFDDEIITIRSLPDGMLKQTLNSGVANQFDFLAIAPNGSVLVSANVDNRFLRFWSVIDSKLINTVDTGDSVSALAISPDGEIVASASEQGIVKLWKGTDGTPLSVMRTGNEVVVSDLAISSDKRWLVTNSWMDQAIKIWSIPEGKIMGVLTWPESLGAPLSLAADSQHLYTVHHHPYLVGSLIVVWDLQTRDYCDIFTP